MTDEMLVQMAGDGERLADLRALAYRSVITADKGAKRRVADFGEAGWMTKPIDFGRLLELVNEHC